MNTSLSLQVMEATVQMFERKCGLNAHFRQCDVTVAHTLLFLVLLFCIVHARICRTTAIVLVRKCVNRLTRVLKSEREMNIRLVLQNYPLVKCYFTVSTRLLH